MERRAFFLLCLILPCILRAQEDYKSPELGITFPGKLAGMTLVKVTNYEEESPGLGVGLSYRSEKEKADIYIYNNRLTRIADGIGSAEIQQHFKDVAVEILEMEKRGHYRNVKIVVPLEKIQVGSQPFLHAEVQFESQDIPRISHIYLSALNDNYFKIRYTYVASESEEGKKVLESLLKSLGPALSPRPI